MANTAGGLRELDFSRPTHFHSDKAAAAVSARGRASKLAMPENAEPNDLVEAVQARAPSLARAAPPGPRTHCARDSSRQTLLAGGAMRAGRDPAGLAQTNRGTGPGGAHGVSGPLRPPTDSHSQRHRCAPASIATMNRIFDVARVVKPPRPYLTWPLYAVPASCDRSGSRRPAPIHAH